MPPSHTLAGRRVVITQAVHQAPELSRLLTARGAEPLLYPCIAILPPADTTVLDNALRGAANGAFDWLVFTSANTVRIVAERMATLGLDATHLRSLSIAAIGTATAAGVWENLGLPVDLVPDESVAEGLAATFSAVAAPGERVLLPQADIARPILAQQLTAAGFVVTTVAAYRTVTGSGGMNLAALLAAEHIDAVILTSSSTARNLVRRLQSEGGDPRCLEHVCIVCIGPVTAATVQELGLPATVVAQTQSLEGLIEALETYWNESL